MQQFLLLGKRILVVRTLKLLPVHLLITTGDSFVEKIIDNIPVDVANYNDSCVPGCVNGQCIPPGLCACTKGWSGDMCSIGMSFV